MKKIILGATALAALVGAGSAFAQNCTASSGALSGANSNSNVAFDTCTATDQLAVSCSGLNPIGPAQDAIWSLQIGPGAHSGSIGISTTTATFDIYAGIMSGSCSGGSPCPVEADSGGAGGAESLDIGALANGTYYLLVTSFGASCGPVTVALPTLPVALQTFSVE
jgi:hypothetical protein